MKDRKDRRIQIRASQRTIDQLAELRRALSAREGYDVSDGQAVAHAINADLHHIMGGGRQATLFSESIQDKAGKGKVARQKSSPRVT